MGYEPECRVLGLGVLPPRVPPSRPARQASSARDRKKRLVKERELAEGGHFGGSCALCYGTMHMVGMKICRRD